MDGHLDLAQRLAALGIGDGARNLRPGSAGRNRSLTRASSRPARKTKDWHSLGRAMSMAHRNVDYGGSVISSDDGPSGLFAHQ